MPPELSGALGTALLYSTLPGGAGGLASFLTALKFGHYRNNKHIRKLLIEVAGAMTTASFVTFIITPGNYRIVVAFSIGVAWAAIIQVIRTKITKIVEIALGEQLEKEKR